MSDNRKQTEQQRPDDREQQAQSGRGAATPRVPALQEEMEQYKQEHGDVKDGTDGSSPSGQWPRSESGQDTSILRASRPVEATATEVAPGGDPAAPELSPEELAFERLDKEVQELQAAGARLMEESASIDSKTSRIFQEFEEGVSPASNLNELRDDIFRGLRISHELQEIVDRKEKIVADFREYLRQSQNRAMTARIEELRAELNTARIRLDEEVNIRRDI